MEILVSCNIIVQSPFKYEKGITDKRAYRIDTFQHISNFVNPNVQLEFDTLKDKNGVVLEVKCSYISKTPVLDHTKIKNRILNELRRMETTTYPYQVNRYVTLAVALRLLQGQIDENYESYSVNDKINTNGV